MPGLEPTLAGERHVASDGTAPDTTGRRVAWLAQATRWLENSPEVDRISPAVATAAGPFNRPPLADALRGTWLGHALHPLLTDVPLGCWISALVLDMVPGRERASQNLIAAGLAAVPLTALAGLAEWETMNRPEEKRVATVHAVGNTVAAAAFARSWGARRDGRQARGVMWAVIGGGLGMITAYLGGHMSYAQKVGTGPRGAIPSGTGIRVNLVRSGVPQG